MNGDRAGAVSADDLTVRDNAEIHRFEAVDRAGDVVGYLVYDPVPARTAGGKGMFVTVRTVVEAQAQAETQAEAEAAAQGAGSGVAALLARTALDHAREHHATVIAECPSVHAFIEQHPEYQDLLP